VELFSEINNAANEIPTDPATCGPPANYQDDSLYIQPYEDIASTWGPIIHEWQNEMAQYIKEDLLHTKHPLAVNYAGAPSVYDSSYTSEYIDVMTFNRYQLVNNKGEHVYHCVVDEQGKVGQNKPLMHSEYGHGIGAFEFCDQGEQFLKTLAITPFTGLAGAMNWDWQATGEDFHWHFMGPVRNFVEGIPLDEENWVVREPKTLLGKGVEMYFLQKPKVDGTSRVVGVLANRTFNFFTISDTLPCHDPDLSDIALNKIYQDTAAFTADNFKGLLKIDSLMGSNNRYRVDWFDALTGAFIDSVYCTSDLFGGDLEFNIPFAERLTGNFDRPIMFFAIYPEDESFK
jgi:hypothetical protein